MYYIRRFPLNWLWPYSRTTFSFPRLCAGLDIDKFPCLLLSSSWWLGFPYPHLIEKYKYITYIKNIKRNGYNCQLTFYSGLYFPQVHKMPFVGELRRIFAVYIRLQVDLIARINGTFHRFYSHVELFEFKNYPLISKYN